MNSFSAVLLTVELEANNLRIVDLLDHKALGGLCNTKISEPNHSSDRAHTHILAEHPVLKSAGSFAEEASSNFFFSWQFSTVRFGFKPLHAA